MSDTPEFGEMSFEQAIQLVEARRVEREPETAPEPTPQTSPAPTPEPPKVEPAPSPENVRAAQLAQYRAERDAAAKQIEELQRKLADAETKTADVERERARFRRDPVGYLKEFDPEIKRAKLAEDLWYEELGDAAPAEYKARRGAERAASLVDNLEARVDQKVEAKLAEFYRQQQEAVYAQYVGAVQAFVAAPPAELPLVKRYAAANPEGVTKAALKIAEKAAVGGRVLTPNEAAAQLERELTTLRSVLGVDATTTPTPTTPAASTTTDPNPTLRNKDQQAVASRTDADDDEVLFRSAIEAAKRVRAVNNPGG